ncbi:MAG: DUF1624 domain-containing protein [Rhodoblastus sp.]
MSGPAPANDGISHARIAVLDMARGGALVAMFAYHLVWDFAHFGLIDAQRPFRPDMRLFSHVIACAFLFIAGVSMALAQRTPFDWRAYWRRIAMVGAAAALVTLASWLLFPQALIFFGILHCIAAASLLALPFQFLRWPAAAIAGIICFALPELATPAIFETKALIWIGLGKTMPLTNDFRPLLPWAGALLIGLAAGKAMAGTRAFAALAAISGANPPARLLAFGGRHSLLVYLVHQPIFFGVLTAAVWAFGPPAPAGEQPFRAACERQCTTTGAGAAQCQQSCACVVRTIKRLDLWDKLNNTGLNSAEQTVLGRVARDCAK